MKSHKGSVMLILLSNKHNSVFLLWQNGQHESNSIAENELVGTCVFVNTASDLIKDKVEHKTNINLVSPQYDRSVDCLPLDKVIYLERMSSNYIFVYKLISCKNFKIMSTATFVNKSYKLLTL